jgi:D-cysteine desulfhydrase family pyridoxal phosphate-dependent enzyme
MIPRVRVANLPTPVEELQRLSEALGGPEIWVKRDDLTGGLGFSGNKTRKLEFVLAEAQAEGARTLITVGSVQSNHCRQTAAFATRFGMDCILVLFGRTPGEADGNLLLDSLFGARVVWTDREKYQEALNRVFEDAKRNGEKPYLIPLGASTPTGTLGYAFAMKELVEQGVKADTIVFASSSCGTQAGMVLGARLFGFTGRILGISIDHNAASMQMRIASLASEASTWFGERIEFSPAEIFVNDEFNHAGYAVLGALETEAIRLFARTEGLLVDPVYTGRAAGGMIELIRRGDLTKDQKVLFWHTGGTPALFAQPYEKMLQGATDGQ